jgi:hypothetical protein
MRFMDADGTSGSTDVPSSAKAPYWWKISISTFSKALSVPRQLTSRATREFAAGACRVVHGMVAGGHKGTNR